MHRLGILVALLLSACFPRSGRLLSPVQEVSGMDEELAGALTGALLDGQTAISAPAVTQVVRQGPERWAAASGWAKRGKRPVRIDDVFRIGSITKTYTAAVVVSLHVEGVLHLDDLVSSWVPDAPHGDRYTIRQLLAHQTGLADFVRTPRFAFNLGKRETMRELLDYVRKRSLKFSPGTNCQYSNTNYLIAGLIIQEATGRPWGVEVRERLLEPAGLAQTWIPSIEDEPEDMVRGYVAGFDVTRRFEPSRATAGGEIVATADDVADFVQALFFGRLVHPKVVELMTTEVPTVDGRPTGHGLGVKIADTPHGRLLGHSGSTVSFQSRFHVHEETGTVVVSLANSFFSEADELDERAWTVLARLGALEPPETEVASAQRSAFGAEAKTAAGEP